MSITGADVVREVRLLAERNPSFVYELPEGSDQCMYVHPDGIGGCIVGRALMILGVDPVTLHEHEFNSAGTVLDRLEIDSTPEERDWLILVQAHQDEYEPWGEAVYNVDNPKYVVGYPR